MELLRWTRRNFLKGLGMLSAAAGGLSARDLLAANNRFAIRGTRVKVYEQLGVRPLINAAGTYTALSGCIMPREVTKAMEEASRLHVSIPELQEAVGKRIAELLGVEAALVTAGAACALTLGTAACVAGSDPEKIKRIPDTTGMKNEVIIQKSHRFAYDHAVRNVGVRLIEVETREEMERAINERTAMMLFLNANANKGKIGLEEFVQIGKKYGVPTFNDCAADVPPLENLTKYIRMGFDLVTFSGGKGLLGPQCSGLLLGRKDLIQAAFLNGSPHSDTIGRLAKVGKEEIIGLLTAIELYLKRNHAAEWREWENRVQYIAKALSTVPGVKTEMFVPEIANHTPHLSVQWDQKIIPLVNEDVVKQLREGEPRIEVRPSDKDKPVVEVAVWMLQPGEHRIVARRLREVLAKAASSVAS